MDAAAGDKGRLEPPSPQSTRDAPGGRSGRNMWTAEETQALVDGCNRHGIGCWKQILSDPEFRARLPHRTPGDLKDRFRTYFPDTYHEMYPNAKTHWGNQARGRGADGRSIFGRGKAKERRPFSAEEDSALIRGYNEHGTHWARIARDPVFQNQRRSTDVRDRFRNAFPQDYERAGYKPRKSSGKDREREADAEGRANDEADMPGAASSVPPMPSTPTRKRGSLAGARSMPSITPPAREPSYRQQDPAPSYLQQDPAPLFAPPCTPPREMQRRSSIRAMQRSRSTGTVYKRRSSLSRENLHSGAPSMTATRSAVAMSQSAPSASGRLGACSGSPSAPPVPAWFEPTPESLSSSPTSPDLLAELGGLSLLGSLPSVPPVDLPQHTGVHAGEQPPYTMPLGSYSSTGTSSSEQLPMWESVYASHALGASGCEPASTAPSVELGSTSSAPVTLPEEHHHMLLRSVSDTGTYGSMEVPVGGHAAPVDLVAMSAGSAGLGPAPTLAPAALMRGGSDKDTTSPMLIQPWRQHAFQPLAGDPAG